jgi:hypothetical protein
MLASHHCGILLVKLLYSVVLVFKHFDDDSEGDKYLDRLVGLVLCFRRLPEDGSPVPKHVGNYIPHELYFTVCISLYFIEWVRWLIYRILL